jgi:lysophospholipase L1-like esterase
MMLHHRGTVAPSVLFRGELQSSYRQGRGLFKLAAARVSYRPVNEKRPSLARRFGLAAVALAVVLGGWLAVEVGLDLADPAGRGGRSDLPEKLRTWNLREHTNLFGNHDLHSRIELRGGSWVVEKPAGVRRVICLGSSSTYGAGLTAQEAYPAQLGRLLGDGRQVGNAGWGGYNSLQLNIFLRQVLLRAEPDAVVFYYGGNERFGGDTVAYWRHAKELLVGADRWSPDRREQALAHGTADSTALALVDVLGGSRLYAWLRDRIAGGRRAAVFVAHQGDALDSAVILEQMTTAAVAQGVTVLLAPEVSVEVGLVNPEYAALMAQVAARTAGVEYVNVAPELAAPENFLDTVHFSAHGARVLAEHVAAALAGKAGL